MLEKNMFSTRHILQLFLIQYALATFNIERHVEKSTEGQKPRAPFLSQDFFQVGKRCTIPLLASCSKYNAQCDGIISCCYCECKKWETFTSLLNGCQGGDGFNNAMARHGLACHYISTSLPYNVPSFTDVGQLKAGIKFSIRDVNNPGIDMTNSRTSCTASRLFYINRNANERLISDNGCDGVFTTEFRQSMLTSQNGWFIKWTSNDTKIFNALSGKLLKLEIQCTDFTFGDSLISCLHMKISGRYDDEKSLLAFPDVSCPPTTFPPSTVSTPTTINTTVAQVTQPAPLTKKRTAIPLIIGAICGILLLLIIIMVLFIIHRRRKRQQAANQWDARYERPIINDVDGTASLSRDHRYYMDTRMPNDTGPGADDSEYAVIDETLPTRIPEYAVADECGSLKKPQKLEYRASENPYYKPALDEIDKPNNNKDEWNITYVPSLPRAPSPIYDDPHIVQPSSVPAEYEEPIPICHPPSLRDESSPMNVPSTEYEEMNHAI